MKWNKPKCASCGVPASSRRWLRTILFAALASAVACGLVSKIAPLIPSAGAIVKLGNQTDWGLLAIVGAACVAYRLANAAVWGWALAAVGQPIGAAQAARIWLSSEACRWLPGSVWNYGSRVAAGVRVGIPASVSSAALALEFALTVGSWLLVAGASAAAAGMYSELPFDLSRGVGGGLILAFGLVAVASMPRLRRKIVAKAGGVLTRLRLLRKVRFKWETALRVFFSYVVLGLFNGAICWLLVCALSPDREAPIATVIAANALAWLAGFFAVFAPAGLGIREGAFVLLLSPFIPWEFGVVVATVWRLAQIAAELLCVGLAMALPLKSRFEKQIDASLITGAGACHVENEFDRRADAAKEKTSAS